MLDVFDEIPFENPDGGAWKQGWDVQYTKDAFDRNKLLIYVIPHSHNDPGMLFKFSCMVVRFGTLLPYRTLSLLTEQSGMYEGASWEFYGSRKSSL